MNIELTGEHGLIGGVLALLMGAAVWIIRGARVGRYAGRMEASVESLRDELRAGFKAVHARLDSYDARLDSHIDRQGD